MHKLHTKTSTGYYMLKGAKTCVLLVLTNLADVEQILNDKPGQMTVLESFGHSNFCSRVVEDAIHH